MTEKEQKKQRVSWYFYDFANSAFPTTVITVFLGPYITQLAESSSMSTGGAINFLFWRIAAGAYFPFIVSLSVIVQVLLLPIIGAIADNSKYKKHILFISAYLGAISTMALYFTSNNAYYLAGVLFIIANINFGASCVVYNSYLTTVAPPKSPETVSSMGWAYGYIGGGILLLLNLYFYSNANNYNISSELAARICLASAGLWWAIFSLIPFFILKKTNSQKTYLNKKKIITQVFSSLFETIKDAKKHPQTLIFLAAYTLYNDGVQAVITFAAQFGSEEIGLSMNVLITSILVIQFVAFCGSLIFGYIAKKMSVVPALRLSIFVWIFAVFFAFLFLKTEIDFYIMGILVGLVLGGTQALSRSIYSQIIPIGKEAEYFSIYEVTEKGTSWLAPFLFGIIYNFSNSYRLAIVSLIVFFIFGFALLLKFDFRAALDNIYKYNSSKV